jgi:stage V sporulation protein D (sporulation-specific penicillin-binding protein)
MAVVFSSLVNGGILIQPSIVETITSSNEDIIPIAKKQKTKIFATATSENIKDALVEVVRYGSIDKIKQPGFSIGAKSGTSEIAYK